MGEAAGLAPMAAAGLLAGLGAGDAAREGAGEAAGAAGEAAGAGFGAVVGVACVCGVQAAATTMTGRIAPPIRARNLRRVSISERMGSKLQLGQSAPSRARDGAASTGTFTRTASRSAFACGRGILPAVRVRSVGPEGGDAGAASEEYVPRGLTDHRRGQTRLARPASAHPAGALPGNQPTPGERSGAERVQPGPHFLGDLALLGQAPQAVLGENQLAIHAHLEHPAL